MKSDIFFCKDCNRYFNNPEYYYETYGFDTPPYEELAICPECGGDDFVDFNCLIEKTEVAQKILPVLMQLNVYNDALKDMFGNKISNNYISDSIETIAELIIEMFDFLDLDMQRKILNVDNNSELEKILMYLDGEL